MNDIVTRPAPGTLRDSRLERIDMEAHRVVGTLRGILSMGGIADPKMWALAAQAIADYDRVKADS